MDWLKDFWLTLWATVWDITPIVLVLFGFQYGVLRQKVAQLPLRLVGLACVALGLALFLLGLERALFPLGDLMASQLTAPAFLGFEGQGEWWQYYWIYIFAFSIGFATTIAEPSLIAVAIKASQVSGGTIHPWGLRLAVALGVAVGIALGAYRIVVGDPLHWYILVGYLVVIIQTRYAPDMIVPLAYDSGGVTTSTVTVPLVAALGLGLATAIPGRSPLIDGFGLIAFASLFPIISVMAYAQINLWVGQKRQDIRGKECDSN